MRKLLILLASFAVISFVSVAANAAHPEWIVVNGKAYQWPTRPTVIILIDGNDPDYIRAGLEQGSLPNFKRLITEGFSSVAISAMPSFTNPNNISVITGVPPAAHGITGNFFLNPETGKDVMMDQPEFLRTETILAAFSRRGAKVVALTAKNKLARMLASGLDMSTAITFSSEKADTCGKKVNGIDDCLSLIGRKVAPDPYSPDLSLAMMEAAVRIFEREKPDLMYLSTSDFVQHSYAPGSKEAGEFYTAIDRQIGRLLALGATVAVTGDHGMNDKSKPDGSANVIFLQDVLDDAFGVGSTEVILPITDPYVRHHGALGSYATLFIRDDKLSAVDVLRVLNRHTGIDMVMERFAAARTFELPADRIGDVIVSADRNTVLGTKRADHDLTQLAGHRLRSHGGLSDRNVSMLFSRPLTDNYAAIAASRQLRNFDVFDFALNGLN